jgi:putative flippase GtrA
MQLFSKYPTLSQLIRYGITGVASNLMGYLVYLLLTYFWLSPKTTVSILYPISATLAYFSHMKYSFSYQGKQSGVLLRYVLVYLTGYFLNIMLLWALHDQLQIPHQIVQIIAIPIIAIFLFVTLKYFVFFSSLDRAVK